MKKIFRKTIYALLILIITVSLILGGYWIYGNYKRRNNIEREKNDSEMNDSAEYIPFEND